MNSMVSLNNSITEFEKDNIVRQAAFSLGKRGKISSSGLLKEITKFEIPKGFDTMNYAKYAIIILGKHVKQVAAIGYIKRLGKVIQE